MKPLQLSSKTRFLLIRPDKIGDVILTTPSVSSLRKKYPESYIAFLCSSYTAPILENHPDIDLILKTDEPDLPQKIKKQEFDAALHFYLDTPTVLTTWKAGIPIRIGPFSKLISFLLTHRITQNRSQVLKHEAEYNLDLVKFCGADGISSSPFIFISDKEKKRGKDILSELIGNEKIKPIIIHPGSAGSVKNWPLDSFMDLAKRCAENGEEVVFTGGKGEENLLEKATQVGYPNIRIIQAGSLTLRELAAVISNGKLMISNSTGPLHIATALGIPTVSFYPHLPKVTSAKRWGPFGNSRINKILTPESESDPLSSISAKSAFDAIKELI